MPSLRRSPATRRTDPWLDGPGGRRIGWSDLGDPTGAPVVFCHGSPGSRLDARVLDHPAREASVRLVAVDRPGHGLSDHDPDRTLGDWPADVALVADRLGLDRFGLLGHSGGGPYALACVVAGSPVVDRVDTVVLAGPAGPMETPGAAEGMSATDRHLTWLCLRAPVLARAYLRGLAVIAGVAPRLSRRSLAWELGGPDARAVLSEPPRAVMAGFREACRHGGAGPALDFRLLSLPWGLDLASVRHEVRVLQGERDRVVPRHQVDDVVSSLSRARLEVVAGGGHLLTHTHPDLLLQPFLA